MTNLNDLASRVEGAAFEAVINGNELEAIDPVVRIIIDNGFHHYSFSPEEVQHVEVRAIASQKENSR